MLAEAFGVFTVAGEGFLDSFFFPAYVGAFVFPIPAVACDIEQILVEVDIIAANNFACVIDDVIGQTGLACDFYGERAAGLSDCEFELRPHLLAVVEHGAVDKSGRLFCKLLQIMVVGGNDAPHTFGVELL